MEEIDLRKYLSKLPAHKLGRIRYNPVNMLKTVLFGFMDEGCISLRKLEDNCKVNIRYKYLMDGKRPSYRTFRYFINTVLMNQAESLFYEITQEIITKEHVDLDHLYIDGSKFEANANKYSWVWKKGTEKSRFRLFAKISALLEEINEMLSCGGLKAEINSEYAPEYLELILSKLHDIWELDEERFAHGKGHHKSPEQRNYEKLKVYLNKLKEYRKKLSICGENRNSYSKTDLEATFMRMKEDHMLNGQLKPAYNVQIAVENYFIVHGYVSNDRTDYNTLIPVLEKHQKAFGKVLDEVTADSGYCSEKNLLYLKHNGIASYIKLQDHEKRKTRAYKEDISKYYNMTTHIFEDERYYICHDGRELRHIRTESKEQDGYSQTWEVYGCADCSGCEHKSRCLYKYNAEKNSDRNKVMKINERWEELKEESNANIQSEEGILKRQTRSIQTEGHFGDIKENENFRRFNYRSAEKVYKEFMLYAIGRNLMKYHRFLHHEIEKYEGKKGQKTA